MHSAHSTWRHFMLLFIRILSMFLNLLLWTTSRTMFILIWTRHSFVVSNIFFSFFLCCIDRNPFQNSLQCFWIINNKFFSYLFFILILCLWKKNKMLWNDALSKKVYMKHINAPKILMCKRKYLKWNMK